MSTTPIDLQALSQEGALALQSGDARKARDAFERIVAAGQADAGIWLALAYACRELKDQNATIAAIDKVLVLQPRNLRALIMKADNYAVIGNTRGAESFYKAAIKSAPPANQLQPDILKELQRAQEMRQRYAEQYETHLNNQLNNRGYKRGQSSDRFTQSLDLLLGKKQLFLQEPAHYYFPELPQIQYYNRKDFPWLDGIEEATDDIRVELQEVMKDNATFSPYIERNPDRWVDDTHDMIENPNWSAFYLWKNGAIVPENAASCPKTVAALQHAPLASIKNRTPSVLFSLLRPGTHIPPHTGAINVRLICHLPLIIPGNCYLRVGNDTRAWSEGKAWVFDDTIQHEAWNKSDKTRVILIFDIWRPELSEDEQNLISALFETIDAYGKKQLDWDV